MVVNRRVKPTNTIIIIITITITITDEGQKTDTETCNQMNEKSKSSAV